MSRRDLETGDDALDRERLAAVAGGDRIAFEQLYLGYHAQLMRFLSRHTARRDLVEEIVNQTMWVVWRSANRFRGESRPRTWILGIAYRTLLKALRDHPSCGAQINPDRLHEDPELERIDDVAQAELRDWVGHGMALLPVEQRMTIELAYYLGQSCEEIAAIMDCAVGTVKARLFHARVRLRNTLPGLGGADARATCPRGRS